MLNKGYAFSLIGPGRVGSSLGLALARGGWHCDSLVRGSGAGAEAGKLRRYFHGSHILGQISALEPSFHVLFLTVSDDRIEIVASELAGIRGFNWKGKVVLHVSGVVAVDALSQLKKVGASTGAFHPISPFATKFSPESAQHTYYDFLGDRTAATVARAAVRTLSSRLLLMKSEQDRILLHAASVIASNFTVIAKRGAERAVSGSTDKKTASALLQGLLVSTVENLSHHDDMSALTGPLARGDVGAVERHLASLENDPLLLQFYKSSSLLGIDLLLKEERNAARRRNLSRIRKFLEG